MPNYLDTRTGPVEGEVMIFATCHGWVVHMALSMSPAFGERCRIHFVESWEGDVSGAISVAANVNLLLVQHDLAGLAPENLRIILSHMRPDVRIVRFASIGYTPLWPYSFRDWNEKPGSSGQIWFPFGDRWVLRHVNQGMPRQEIITRYLNLDVAREVDLGRLHELWRMDAIEKDEAVDVMAADIVEEEVKARHAFFSPYHCSNRVILRIVDRILLLLEKPPLLAEVYARPDVLKDFELPIHPSVAQNFDITYANPDRLYLSAAGLITFSEYYGHYIAHHATALAEKDLASADEMLRAGQYDDAARVLASVEMRTGPTFSLHSARAAACFQQRDNDAAIVESTAAIALKPTRMEGYYWGCAAAFYKGDYLATLGFGFACLKCFQGDTAHDILVWIADSQLRIGLPDVAIPVYRRALAQQPQSANALLGLSIALLRIGDQAQARNTVVSVEANSPQRLKEVWKLEFNDNDIVLLEPFVESWPLAAYIVGANALMRGNEPAAIGRLTDARSSYLSAGLSGMAQLCADLLNGFSLA